MCKVRHVNISLETLHNLMVKPCVKSSMKYTFGCFRKVLTPDTGIGFHPGLI